MKNYKYLFIALVVLIALTNNIFATTPTSPNNKYDQYLSDHPLTATELKSGKYAAQKILSGKDTYTYVRCYYKLSTKINKPGTDYVWAQNANGSDYKLKGYWYADGISEWKNMFYTNTLASDIKTACEATLKKEGKNALVDIYAADNFMSFDHTIWHNKLNNISTSQFDKIISFGDSLSDTHNIYNGSQWKLPNNSSWYLGRFSNYKLWTEYLAEELNVPLYTWAVGGASGETNYILIPSLSQQIQSYEEYMQEAKNYNPDKTLFTIWIGSNDLVKYKRTVDETIADIDDSLYELINTGAKHIIILNLPDATFAPTFKYRTDEAKIEKNIRELNTKLAKSVNTIKWAYGNSVDLQLFDANATFNDLMVNSSHYGITNITDSCLDINDNSSTKYIETHKVRLQCTDANKYVFWDLIHPTTMVHKLLAQKILAVINKPINENFIYALSQKNNIINSYQFKNNGQLLSSAKADTGNYPTQISFSTAGNLAIVSNMLSNTISLYQVQNTGTLSKLQTSALKTNSGPTDVTFIDDKTIAVLELYSKQINTYHILDNYALELISINNLNSDPIQIEKAYVNKVPYLFVPHSNSISIYEINKQLNQSDIKFKNEFRLNADQENIVEIKYFSNPIASTNDFIYLLTTKNVYIYALNSNGRDITLKLKSTPTANTTFNLNSRIMPLYQNSFAVSMADTINLYTIQYNASTDNFTIDKSDKTIKIQDPNAMEFDKTGNYLYITSSPRSLYRYTITSNLVVTKTPDIFETGENPTVVKLRN